MNDLSLDPIFDSRYSEGLSEDERIALSYKRARKILLTYNLTAADVANYTEKFWHLHISPAFIRDIAAFTIVTVNVNLAVGTLARHLETRPDLEPLIQSMLRLDVVGLYLMSELGHGLDVNSIETTATQNAHGFVLETPRPEATKFMPATTPLFGISKVALVMARLMVNGKDHGLRMFVTPICSTDNMYPGVVSRRLPALTGRAPLDFSLTSFHNVQLPHSALLGPQPSPSSLVQASQNSQREKVWDEMHRLRIGAMVVAAPFVEGIKHVVYTATKYSMHRTVVVPASGSGNGPKAVPIIMFPAQHSAMLRGLATAQVLNAWYRRVMLTIVDKDVDDRWRHAIAVIVKATVVRDCLSCMETIRERCGTQGLLQWNHMAQLISDLKGGAIAEGDVLTLCTRLLGELSIGKYPLTLPPADSTSLAKKAHEVLSAARKSAQQGRERHRSYEFQQEWLSVADQVCAVFGRAMALATARELGVSRELCDVFEVMSLEQDAIQTGVTPPISRVAAMRAALPLLEEEVGKLAVDQWAKEPITHENGVKDNMVNLATYASPISLEGILQSTTPPRPRQAGRL
ncbi:hypothetical protein V8C42DRAFT_361209 [Trichoderma barbatum]